MIFETCFLEFDLLYHKVRLRTSLASRRTDKLVLDQSTLHHGPRPTRPVACVQGLGETSIIF